MTQQSIPDFIKSFERLENAYDQCEMICQPDEYRYRQGILLNALAEHIIDDNRGRVEHFKKRDGKRMTKDEIIKLGEDIKNSHNMFNDLDEDGNKIA